MNTTVFVVSSFVEYEGSDMLRAFATQEAAGEFMSACYAHQRIKPEYSDGKSFQAFDRKHEAWAKKHPAGPGCRYVDGFRITEIPYTAGPTP